VSCVQDEGDNNEFMFNMGKQSYMNNNESRASGDDGSVFNDLFKLRCSSQPEFTLSEPSANKMLPFDTTGATFQNKGGTFYFGQDKDDIVDVSNSTYCGSFEFSFGCNTSGSVLDTSPRESGAFSLSLSNSISSPRSDDNPFKFF